MNKEVKAFAEELRKWWSFDERQQHTHSWHSREDFIALELPKLLAAQKQELKRTIENMKGTLSESDYWKGYDDARDAILEKLDL